MTPLRPTTPGDEEGVVNNTQLFFLPLGLVSRDCQDHKGAGDPRQEDIGGARNKEGWMDGWVRMLIAKFASYSDFYLFECVHDDDLEKHLRGTD